jgi:hypothetical protein
VKGRSSQPPNWRKRIRLHRGVKSASTLRILREMRKVTSLNEANLPKARRSINAKAPGLFDSWKSLEALKNIATKIPPIEMSCTKWQ